MFGVDDSSEIIFEESVFSPHSVARRDAFFFRYTETFS
jgi:hypothetical protein